MRRANDGRDRFWMLTGRRKVTTRLDWSACLLCVALAAASLILALLNERTLGEIVEEGIVAVATLTVAFAVVGTLIASHRPENPIGWIFCAAAFCQGLSISGYEYATYALITEPGSLSLGAEASWLPVDLGSRARPDPGVPAPPFPGWSPAFASLAPGGLARRPLHWPGRHVVHDPALAREGARVGATRRRGGGRHLPRGVRGNRVRRVPDDGASRARRRGLAVIPL
jgi:hypothetical protein